MTANQVVIGLAVALAVWYFVGSAANRRRANQLARTIYHALPPLGERASIRPVGSGSSAFHVEVDRPARGLRTAQILCLLEARDFPVAWLWMRLRGFRDRIVVKAELERAPGWGWDGRGDPPEGWDPGLRRLIQVAVRPDAPHVHLAFGVGAGEEDEIARALEWIGRVARGGRPAGT